MLTRGSAPTTIAGWGETTSLAAERSVAFLRRAEASAAAGGAAGCSVNCFTVIHAIVAISGCRGNMVESQINDEKLIQSLNIDLRTCYCSLVPDTGIGQCNGQRLQRSLHGMGSKLLVYRQNLSPKRIQFTREVRLQAEEQYSMTHLR